MNILGNFDPQAVAQELDAAVATRPPRARVVGGEALVILLVATMLGAASPRSVRAQVSKTANGYEIDLTTTVARERSGVDFAASGKGLWGSPFVCDAAMRAAGKCPDTITVDQNFRIRKAQDCVAPQDLMATRGRCLYGRGPAVATSASLPSCAAEDFGYITQVEDEAADYWCDGSVFAAVTDQAPGAWRGSMVQCGAGPVHDVWPDGGPLPSVDAVVELPTCSSTFNNSRAWVGASNHNYPHATATLWRCRDPGGGFAWEVNVPAYREDTTDANLAAVCRTWQTNGRAWNSSDPFWMPPPLTAADGWLGLQPDDVIERWLEMIVLKAVNAGLEAQKGLRDEP